MVSTSFDHSGARARVLVVEDDPAYREELVAALGQEGFAASVVTTADEGLRSLVEWSPDIVLLDVVLPDRSGIDVCRRMRELRDTPVILLSAQSDELDVVLGLELGAADYVTKPYRVQELIARLRAVLRRTMDPTFAPRPESDPVEPESDQPLRVGRIEVHLVARKVYAGGTLVHLARREFDLLAVLACPPGVVRTREELIDRVWEGTDLTNTRTLDRHIMLLRAKIEVRPTNPEYLTTIHGVGFRLEDHPRKTAPPRLSD